MASEEDGDDISLLSDSDTEAEPAPVATRSYAPSKSQIQPGSQGPTLWSEVNTEALQQLAASIVAVSLPAGDDAALGQALPPATPAHQPVLGGYEEREARPRDPLGLVQLDAALRAALDGEGAGTALPRQVSAVARAAAAADGPSTYERLLVTGPHFDPGLYLATIHKDTTLAGLQMGMRTLQAQLEEHSAALRGLVRDNFGRFISSKSTIDDIQARLRRIEAGGAASGAPSAAVLAGVSRARAAAARAFDGTHARAQRAERIRTVLGLLGRYEAWVGLPGRLRAAAAAGARGRVAAEYARARGMLDQAGREEEGAGAWGLLSAEVDKAAGEAAAQLLVTVECGGVDPEEVLDAMRSLLALEAAGVPAAQGCDPGGLFVKSQEGQVGAMLEAQRTQRDAMLHAAEQQAALQRELEEEATAFASLGIPRKAHARRLSMSVADDTAPPGPGAAAADPGPGQDARPAAVAHVVELTRALLSWLPGFVAVAGPGLSGLADELAEGAAPARARLAAAADAGAALVASTVSTYSEAVHAVLDPDPSLGAAVLDELAEACEALEGVAGTAGLPTLRALASHAALSTLRCLARDLHAEGEALAAALLAPRDGGGAACEGPGSAATALSLLTQRGAAAAAGVLRCLAAAGADDGAPGLVAAGADAALAPLTTLAEAVAGAAAVSDGGTTLPPRAGALLRGAAAARAARRAVLPSLVDAWGEGLLAGTAPACAACSRTLAAAERAALRAHVRSLQAMWDGAVEALSAPPGREGWARARAAVTQPRAPTRAALRALCLAALDVAEALPADLARDALAEVALGLLGSCTALCTEGLPPDATAPGVAQAWLDTGTLAEAAARLAPGDADVASAAAELRGTQRERLLAALARGDGEGDAALRRWALGGKGGDVAEGVERRIHTLLVQPGGPCARMLACLGS
ncbi:SEC5 [Auxenochlorella protothecoides x Auxenochlorella symbiontica]